jgi:hypothetical protein
MKKYLLILLASVLFVFDGSAQCTGGLISATNLEICPRETILIYSNNPPTNTSTNIIYQWELNGSPIVNKNYETCILNDEVFDNLNFFTLRRKVTDLDNSCIAYSNTLSMTVKISTPLQKGSILGNETICSGSASTIISSNTLPSGGVNIFKYEWFKSNGDGWNLILGATNSFYDPGILTETTSFVRIDGNSECFDTAFTNLVTKIVMPCGTFSSNITGPATITPGQTATYSVPDQPGMKYLWSVTSGTITSGQGTYTITIMWDGGASSNNRTSITDYSLSVTETNDIDVSNTITKDITMITTGINKSFASSGISLFPNPITRDSRQFTIEMPTAGSSVGYTIYTTTGVQMQTGSFTSVASGNTIATQLPAGIYQLVLNADGVFSSTRLAVVE